MMKVNKNALDEITFIGHKEKMNIKGIHLAGDVHMGEGDNYTIISQTPSRKLANGRCTENPCKCFIEYHHIATGLLP